MPLVYRNTFIQEVEVDGASRRRASSQEPHRSPALAAEALEMERTLKHFATCHIHMPHCFESKLGIGPSKFLAAGCVVLLQVLKNRGS